MQNFNTWVACWGNATSITDRKESVYAKDITLRYPIRICFNGNKIRLRFSNHTGTEDVTLTHVFVAIKDKEIYEPIPVLFDGKKSVTISEKCAIIDIFILNLKKWRGI